MKIFSSRSILAVLSFVLPVTDAVADTGTFTNFGGIVIESAGTAPIKATPYPSSINVAGLTGSIQKVTLKLSGLTHTFPDDIDILLIAPDGTQSLVFSDAGGSFPLSGVTVELDDDAASPLPDGTAISSGIYRPGNYAPADSFPAPAPLLGSNTTLAAFRGINPTGVWSLYIVDDVNVDAGSLTNWSLTITTAVPATPGQLVISEFRVRGANGAADEFVEIHNATDATHMVQSIDGSAGYALAASDGVTRFVIPNGTLIPARGHYLGVNSAGYNLSSHPSGNGTTATGDATYTTGINDNAGIALFRTSASGNFNLANRLDAVGSTAESNSLYREGTGYRALTPFSVDYSFYRDLLSGVAKDSGDNASDFVFVDTNGTSAGAGQRLGSPGPQNLSSPLRSRTGASLVRGLPDPAAALSSAPNRIRDFTSNPANNSTFGSLSLNRKFTNSSGTSLTRLRFRIVDLTTFPAPSGISDLRPLTGSDVSFASSAGPAAMKGSTLEQPPSLPNGGGFNSTLAIPSITPTTPLASGSSVNIRFLFGIQQTGDFRVAMIPETFPVVSSGIWIIRGNTENAAVEVETLNAPITSVRRIGSDVRIDSHCAPGVIYQLQRSTNLTNWTDVGPSFLGNGLPGNYIHTGAATAQRQFYRFRDVP